MANVIVDLGPTTTYSQSELSFNCRTLKNPYGRPEDPRIRIVCTGRFDPAGSGDVQYRAVCEVNQHGDVKCLELELVNGEATLMDKSEYFGFMLYV
jgi:hypothetical protein